MTKGWKGWGVSPSAPAQSQKQGGDVNVKRITQGGGEDKHKDGDDNMHMQGVEIQQSGGAEGSRVNVLEKDKENQDVQNRNPKEIPQDEEMEIENVKDNENEKVDGGEGKEKAREEDDEEKQRQLTKARERVKGLAKLTKGYGGADLRVSFFGFIRFLLFIWCKCSVNNALSSVVELLMTNFDYSGPLH